MKISCEIIQDLLPLYCDGVCSGYSKQAVETHLETCEKCRADMRFMEQDMKASLVGTKDEKIVKAAAAAWKKRKTRAFVKGFIIALLSITVVVAVYFSFHWFSTANENDLDALAHQAADSLGYDELVIKEVQKKGNYLAALCKDTKGNWCMCVFDRDDLFENRWCASGGNPSIDLGTVESWNYGSPQNEAVLIFCGVNISDEVHWYQFQNNNITYTCPVENGKVLDIFIIQDNGGDINGHPILSDSNQPEFE